MASSSPEERAFVIRGIIAGSLLSVLIFSLGMCSFTPGTEQEFPSSLEKLVFTLRCQSVSIFTFIFGIGRIASLRFTTAIDPTSGKGEKLIEVDVRYLQNTLEQFLLSFVGQLILSTYLSASALPRVVPTLGALFVLGRLFFYIGYTKSAVHRAAGFAMTFYPNVLVHLYCMYCFLSRSFN